MQMNRDVNSLFPGRFIKAGQTDNRKCCPYNGICVGPTTVSYKAFSFVEAKLEKQSWQAHHRAAGKHCSL